MQKNISDKKVKTKKLAIIAAASVLAFVALAVTVFFLLFWRKSETYGYVFPDYVGSYESDIPQKNGMTVTKNYVSSEIYPEGAVISQYPEGLSEKKIRKGQTPTLALNISTGREKFILPELSGKALNQAQTILRGVQCETRIVRIYGDFLEQKVKSTIPAMGSEIKVGDRVTLYVETPSAASGKEVPSVMGMDEASAERYLVSLGFEVETEQGFDAGEKVGEVISQYPLPNTYTAQKTVKITVNSD